MTTKSGTGCKSPSNNIVSGAMSVVWEKHMDRIWAGLEIQGSRRMLYDPSEDGDAVNS